MWALLLSHWQASSQNHTVTLIVSPCNCLSTIILHIQILFCSISNRDLFISQLPLLFLVSSLNLTSGHSYMQTRYYCTPIFCVPCKTFPRKVKRKTILQTSIIYWRMRDQENCNFLDSMKIVTPHATGPRTIILLWAHCIWSWPTSKNKPAPWLSYLRVPHFNVLIPSNMLVSSDLSWTYMHHRLNLIASKL